MCSVFNSNFRKVLEEGVSDASLKPCFCTCVHLEDILHSIGGTGREKSD